MKTHILHKEYVVVWEEGADAFVEEEEEEALATIGTTLGPPEEAINKRLPHPDERR